MIGQDVVGRKAVMRLKVDASHSADAYGNRGFDLLATPALVGLIEQTAMSALDPALGDGMRSVGGRIELVHRAPTPVGMEIEIRARITAVEGPAVHFDVTASDDVEVVAEGSHIRFVIDRERFVARAKAKSAQQ
jgi:fluoroacetyl-CoA thioesterase